ncbi:MAG: 2-C-methyl-D-erythritol 4-phosphate cytidylyltransferase [Parachlamydiaceae bacterium]
MKIEVILLSGGVGSRMESLIPKQYLLLNGKPIARLSFEAFEACSEVDSIIVVANEGYRDLFHSKSKKVSFASPGDRRQDSLKQGMAKLSPDTDLVLIHDAARPFLTQKMISRAIEGGKKAGAATLALPMRCTVKEGDSEKRVVKTLERSNLYEIQTPQALKKSVLEQGMQQAEARGVTVTDDVCLAEILPHVVELVEGSPYNIKITTPEDLVMAQAIFDEVFREKL